MDKTFRRIVSFVMAMAIILSIGGLNVLAITEEDEATLNFGASNVTVTKSNEAQPVSISFYISENAEIASFGVQNISISDPNQMGVTFAGNAVVANTSFSGMNNIESGSTTGGITMSDITAGHYMAYSSELNGYVLFTLPLTIPANATGTATVTFSQISAADNETGDGYSVNSTPVTATITVEEPKEEVDENAYNVYYKFPETAVDTETKDNFYEIDPGSTIDVQVWVSANSEKTMQAFDIYPLWDATVVGENRVLNVTKVTAAQGFEIVDEMNAAKPHFLTNITVDNGNIDKTVDQDGIHVATMTLSLSNDAEYGIHYPIWFGEDTNLSQTGTAESVETVNVQAQGEIGVETLKTYTVTYDANGGSFEGEAPTQKKQHNVELTLEPGKTPSRDGYTFQGWSTTSGDNNADDMITNYTANEATTLYAIWKANTHTVTWKSQDGSETLATSTVTHGEKPTYGGETPTKVVEGYTVTFAGWATEPNQTSGKPVTELTAVTTDGVVYYAAFTETINQYTITFENTGDTTINPITQDYSTAVTAPPDPEKEGYTFAGWDKTIPATMPAEDVTITAQWTINQYTITFAETGDTTIAPITQDYGTAVTAPANPTKTGYIFKSWDKTIPATMPAEDVTITAQWDPIKYNIAFDIGDGVTGEAPASIEATYDEAVTMPGDDGLTKDGYVLVGWAKDENATEPAYKINTSYDDVNLTTTNGETVTLYAVWKQNVFQITYSNDPTTVTPSNVDDLPSYYNTDTRLEIPNPEADGYTFDGWTSTALKIDANNKAKDLSYDANSITGNIDLTAHWTPNSYTITFNNEDGSEYDTFTQEYGTEVNAPTEPTKTGYTFAGWVNENNEVVNFPTTMPAEDVTLTATWTINQYTITFADTGDTAIAPITQDYGTDVTAPANPTKTGYTFKSWDKEIPATMPAENMTITAQWTINQYTITFNTDGGSTIAAIKQDYNTTVTAPANPTKTGYNFLKWINEKTGADATIPTTIPAEDITLKAIWEAATYNVTLNTNNGTIAEGKEITSYTYNPDTAVTLPVAADMTKEHYTFAGWYGNENLEGTAVTEIPAGSTDDKTYWAKWDAVQYTITFDANGGTVNPHSMSYTYETITLDLPTPTWEYHNFVQWKVKNDSGSWKADTQFNMSAGNYGNVEVYAVWEGSLKHVVEDYKYAPANYVMLRIETTTDNASGYKFGDIEMYYTDADEYKLNGNPVLVTLIPKKDGEIDLIKKATSGNGYELTDAGLDKLSETNAGAREIVRDGKINMNDDIVNIADANAVYQMIVNESIGGYYSIDQLEIYNRLVADMSTVIEKVADHRGSIADVNAIVTIINNAANPTN